MDLFRPGISIPNILSLLAEGAAAAPQKDEVRSKPLVCKALGKSGYDVRKAWKLANTARKLKTGGQTNWNNPFLRETENWLTAASDYYAVPFARTLQIYLHQYRKAFPFSGSTPFSQEALDAGLDGQAHNGDTPEQLKAWCDGK